MAPPSSDQRLQALGYKSEFRRDMSLFGVLGMSFCAIGILTGMSSALQTGLFSGGPLGLFWGWNICSLFMLLIALSLAEICSAYPTMGGLYYWVCKMRPKTPFIGFCTGWIYSIAMIFTGTSGNLSTALYLASIIELSIGRPITRVQITALAWGVNILSGIVNTFGTRAVGALSAFNLWWTLGGTVVLVVTLLVKSPEKNTGTFVFTDYENFTGWSSKTFVVLLGFLQAVYTLEGCETAAQVAEETTRAEMLAPLAIISSIIGSWLIGVVYMLALLFSIRSISSIQATGFAIPIAQLFFDVFNDRTDDSDNGVIGAGSTKQGKSLTFMCIVIIALAQFMAAVTAFAASSRLLYSLARDNAVPTAHDGFYKKWFMALNRYQAPYVGVWISVIVGCAVSCAYIGSPIAFNAILSSAAISVMLSYLQPVIIRVFWPNSFRERGPFTLGKWSWPINVASFLFTVFVCVLFVLPTSHPVSSTTMNYAIVAVGALLLLVVLGWFAWGKDTFKGAVRTLEDEEAEEAEGDVVKETYDGLEKVPEKEKD